MYKNKKIRRIALFGGPGCGKSTTAAYIFYKLKMMGYNTELVTEVVKKDAYRNRKVEGRRQWVRCDQQIKAEEQFLKYGVDYIVTDSPILLHYMYSKSRGELFSEAALVEVRKQDKKYPSLNILLDRGDIPYQSQGRFQKNVDEAKMFDKELQNVLLIAGVDFMILPSRDHDLIFNMILDYIGKPTLEVKAKISNSRNKSLKKRDKVKSLA